MLSVLAWAIAAASLSGLMTALGVTGAAALVWVFAVAQADAAITMRIVAVLRLYDVLIPLSNCELRSPSSVGLRLKVGYYYMILAERGGGRRGCPP